MSQLCLGTMTCTTTYRGLLRDTKCECVVGGETTMTSSKVMCEDNSYALLLLGFATLVTGIFGWLAAGKK